MTKSDKVEWEIEDQTLRNSVSVNFTFVDHYYENWKWKRRNDIKMVSQTKTMHSVDRSNVCVFVCYCDCNCHCSKYIYVGISVHFFARSLFFWCVNSQTKQKHTIFTIFLCYLPFSQMMRWMHKIAITYAITAMKWFSRVITQRTLYLATTPMATILIVFGCNVKIFWRTKTLIVGMISHYIRNRWKLEIFII